MSENKVDKWAVEVEVTLDDGTKLLGSLFSTPLRRISDLLNGDRQFLPFRLSNGRILHLRKVAINQVSELDQVVDINTIVDPYEVLGVSRDINDEDLKDAYHQQCIRNHPDKLMSLDLSPEFVSIANSRLTKIIEAYNRILELRNTTPASYDSTEAA
jgi:hypothetical protein